MSDREQTITLTLSVERAERIQYGLSDAACWMRGFLAAAPEGSNGPMGLEAIRDMNILLKDQLRGEARRLEDGACECGARIGEKHRPECTRWKKRADD